MYLIFHLILQCVVMLGECVDLSVIMFGFVELLSQFTAEEVFDKLHWGFDVFGRFTNPSNVQPEGSVSTIAIIVVCGV